MRTKGLSEGQRWQALNQCDSGTGGSRGAGGKRGGGSALLGCEQSAAEPQLDDAPKEPDRPSECGSH